MLKLMINSQYKFESHIKCHTFWFFKVIFRKHFNGSEGKEVEMRVQFVLKELILEFWLQLQPHFEGGREWEMKRGSESGRGIFDRRKRRELYFYFCCASLVMVPRFFSAVTNNFFVFFLKKTMIWIRKKTMRRKRWNTKTHFIIFKVFLIFNFAGSIFIFPPSLFFVFHETI